MTKEDARQRAATAREHLQVAEEHFGYAAQSAGRSASAQVSVSNAILAGIAAADAICGKILATRAADQDHKAAADLLTTVQPDGAVLAAKFRRLVADKTLLQYGGFCTAKTAGEMTKCARDLIDSMASVHGL